MAMFASCKHGDSQSIHGCYCGNSNWSIIWKEIGIPPQNPGWVRNLHTWNSRYNLIWFCKLTMLKLRWGDFINGKSTLMQMFLYFSLKLLDFNLDYLRVGPAIPETSPDQQKKTDVMLKQIIFPNSAIFGSASRHSTLPSFTGATHLHFINWRARQEHPVIKRIPIRIVLYIWGCSNYATWISHCRSSCFPIVSRLKTSQANGVPLHRVTPSGTQTVL